MITRLIETLKQRFLQEGGIKEQMYKARMQQRGEWSSQSYQKEE
ncbi:MAG: four helix bundle suffix domain-containing protein [Bacteroidaceae bacterium]|nr:four helix bundle suffix domain-containing protein [Bacteroidaceae bacterium]